MSIMSVIVMSFMNFTQKEKLTETHKKTIGDLTQGTISMKTKTGVRKTTGDRIVTYRNKINGTLFYHDTKNKVIIRDGQEFLPVIQKMGMRDHPVLVAKTALERV